MSLSARGFELRAEIGNVVARRCRNANDRNARRGQRPINEVVASPAVALAGRFVVQLDDEHERCCPRVHENFGPFGHTAPHPDRRPCNPQRVTFAGLYRALAGLPDLFQAYIIGPAV
jgi:hypothetical protein